MIESIIVYMIKVALGSSILLCCYWLLFKNETFYVRNRIFLILSVLIPLAIPLITIAPTTVTSQGHSGVIESAAIISTSHAVEASITNTVNQITFIEVLFYIYLAGLLFIMSRILTGVLIINKIIRKGKRDVYQDIPLVLMKSDLAPFTFHNKIFIPEKLYEDEDCGDILRHESNHVRQRHYFDLFLSEFFLAIQWFNPSAWIIRKAIKENHEYMADNYATYNTKSLKRYQLSLLGIHGFEKPLPLANNFNQRIIKKRIIMMNKSKTKPGALLKTLLAIPVVAIIFISLVANSKAINPALPVSGPSDQSVNTGTDFINQETIEFSDNSKRIIRGLFYSIMYPKEAISNNYEHEFYLVLKTENGKIIETSTFLSPYEFSVPVVNQVTIAAFRTGPEATMSKNTVETLNTMMHKRSIDAVQKLDQAEIPELEDKTMEFALKMSYVLFEEDMKDKSFVVVQNMPTFRGGTIDKFKKWVQDRISYPDELAGQGIEGKVFVMFVVEKDGSVKDTKILRGLHPQLDKMAVDIVNSSPLWEPGHLNSEDPVMVRYSITVTFTDPQ